MISFLFKKKYIYVDCFTNSPNIAELYTIKKSFNYVPDWWRNLGSSYFQIHEISKMPFERATMKSCVGFLELYKSGFIIPLWTDIDIFCTQDLYRWHSKDTTLLISNHDSREHNNTFESYHHMKLQTPWMVRETTGIKFLWTPCTWSQLEDAADVKILPAALDFKYQHTTNIQCFVPKSDRTIRLSAGMPLVQVIPMSEKPLKITTHVLDSVEFEKLSKRSRPHKFVGGYLYKKRRMKENENI